MTPDQSADRATPQPDRRPSVGWLLLGAAALAGERLHLLGPDRPPAVALVVGLVADGRDAVAHAATDVARGARQAVPADRMREWVDHATCRGREALSTSRADTYVWLHGVVRAPVTWAESTAIPRVMDDLTPYVTDEFMPRVLDAMMPRIRETVVPAIIEDLTTDPRVRTMITEQSHGAVAAAADELRQVTSNADDQLESAFRRTFSRHPSP